MNEREIRLVPAPLLPKATNALISAFEDSPYLRSLFPEKKQYKEEFGKIANRYAADAINSGVALEIADFSAIILFSRIADQNVHFEGDEAFQKSDVSITAEEYQRIEQFISERRPKGLYWYLSWLGVRQNCRGSGFGTALLEASEKLIRAKTQSNLLLLHLEAISDGSKRFFKRAGFKTIATSGNIPNNTRIFVMQKYLAPKYQ